MNNLDQPVQTLGAKTIHAYSRGDLGGLWHFTLCGVALPVNYSTLLTAETTVTCPQCQARLKQRQAQTTG